MGRLSAISVLAVVAAASACESSAPDGPGSFQVDTLASGMVQVTNDGSGVWTEETAWRLEEDLRLGRVEGGGPDQFSQVAWILEDAQGAIYILDYPAQDIRVFHADGTFSHMIGRQGEGPGEFTRAAGLNWGPDGNLWVWGSSRFSAFTPDGEFVTSHPRRTLGVIYPWNGGWTDDGRYIDWGLDRERTGGSPMETTGLTSMYPIHFTPPETYDTLPPLQFNAWMAGPGRMQMGRNKGIMLAQTRSGDLWFAHTDEYTLFRRTLDGDTLLSASIPSRPDLIPRTEIDSVIQAAKDAGSPREYDPADFVTERRLVTRVLADEAGHIFVFPHEPGVVEGTAMDVFRESGVYLGRIELDETVLTLGPPPYVTDEHLYAVVNDDFDVPFVVRWRIIKPE